MKTILSYSLLIFLTYCAVNADAQDFRKLDDFDAISASGHVEVVLRPGEENSATVYGDEVSPDEVSVYIKGSTLKIQLYDTFFDEGPAKIEVTYKSINELRTSAGARVKHEGTLSAENLKLKASSGSQLEVMIAAKELNASVAEGAVLEIEGTVESQQVHANTGGQYLGLALECNDTTVKSNTGGEAEVVARQRLDANANTGGVIDYKGEPENKTTRSFISGGINHLQ